MPEKTINDIFIENLNKHLEARHMNYADLADALCVSRSTVSMWIGKKSLPRMEILDKIAELFNISSGELLLDNNRYVLKSGSGLVFDDFSNRFVPYNGIYIDVNDTAVPIFSSALKNIRKEKGYTQNSLASKLNVSQSSIYNWESGKSKPDIDMIKEIASALDVPISDLVGVEESRRIQEIFQLRERVDAQLFIEPDESDLISAYRLLNQTGKDEAQKRVQELGEIDKYRAKNIKVDELPIVQICNDVADLAEKSKKKNTN